MEVIFILVEPAVPENIGATARALKTMGFKRLRMVNPSVLNSKKTHVVAHASGDILENAEIFDSFDDAISDLDLTVASSAKKRRTNQDYISASELPQFLDKRIDNISRTGIIFGREESGLTNEEIKKCDLVSFIPMNASYPSLNLSHAVMIYAYLLSGLEGKRVKASHKLPEENLRALKTKVMTILEDIEMKQLHIIGPRISERMSYLSKDDVSLLHSICNAYLANNEM